LAPMIQVCNQIIQPLEREVQNLLPPRIVVAWGISSLVETARTERSATAGGCVSTLERDALTDHVRPLLPGRGSLPSFPAGPAVYRSVVIDVHAAGRTK